MTVKECYQAMGADYEGVLNRLQSEALVEKFTLKFLADPSAGELRRAVAEQRREEAFRAAHTLKGISQNLGFTRLYESSQALTQALRGDRFPECQPLMDRFEQNYDQTVEAIRALEQSLQS